MKRFNIVVGKKYDKNGEEKTQWNNVGTLVHFPATEGKDEGYKLELHIFPTTKFSVFEQKPKEEYKPKPQKVEEVDTIEYPPEEDDGGIPF